MTIVNKYIIKLLAKNLCLTLLVFALLFLTFDFIEKIDNLLPENVSQWLLVEYFAFRLPQIISLMLPVAAMISTMFTLLTLSRNSEIVALRAAGMPIRNLAFPVTVIGLSFTLFALLLNELIVPYSTRRQYEIYNLDIKEKDKSGQLSQSFYWWREQDKFLTIEMFDSRTNRLLKFTRFKITPSFEVEKRTDAEEVKWLDDDLKWSMKNVSEVQFKAPDKKTNLEPPITSEASSFPLLLDDRPEAFYGLKLDPASMSFSQFRRFIRKQEANGVTTFGDRAELYAKLSFPLVILIGSLVSVPFSLRSPRGGNISSGFLTGLAAGFCYYVVHSFSLSLGRAELLQPLTAAWMANIVMSIVAVVLFVGIEES